MRTSVSIDLLDLARTFAARPSGLAAGARWDPAHRWYHRLNAQPDHEAWLLTWRSGTDLHDHGPSAGAFVVVTGELAGRPRTRGLRSGRYAVGVAARSRAAMCTASSTRATDRRSACTSTTGADRMTRYRWQAGALAVAGVDRAGAQW
jgi:hypothetical protein